MKGKSLRIICIGKIKTAYWKNAADHYLELLRKWRDIEYIELKDANSDLSIPERIATEGQRTLEKLGPKDGCISLDENGKMFTSRGFAAFLRNWDEKEQKRLNFIVGGPFGLSAEVKNRCVASLSLSTMTFPHELARVLLLEQLFRGECILNNFPYHH